MLTAILILCLSADGPNDWPLREAAERILTVTMEPEDARAAVLASGCPEARDRLVRIHRAAVLRCIDRILPDDRPFWPDVDATGWPQAETEWEPPHNPWRELRRFHVDDHYDLMRDMTAPSHTRGPYWSPWRARTKSRLVLYILRTGDWEYPKNLIAAAHASQMERGNDPTVIIWGLLWHRPDLLKRTIFQSPASSRN